jgi:enoyl-CoA hydratase
MSDMTIERDDDVATLTLQRPAKKNALSIALRDEISDALDALADDGRVKVVVITGAGDTFSAGFDLKEFENTEPGFQEQLWASSDRYHRRVLSFPLPTVAAVNGAALAGGFDLATMCDMRVAADTAWFARPERLFGDIVYAVIHDLLGGALARDLTLTGRRVHAPEALAIHLVDRVVPAPELADAARHLARTIAEAPRDVLVRTKAKIIARTGIPTNTGTLAM